MNLILKGIITIHTDSIGGTYLAADIPSEEYKPYEDFMLTNGFQDELKLKAKRDKGNYHVTIISSMDWGRLKKQNKIEEFNHLLIGKEFIFNAFGIGKAEKEKNYSYFLVLENEELKSIRETYQLKNHDFHMTLGFKEKDVFGVHKDKNTVIYDPSFIFPSKNKYRY